MGNEKNRIIDHDCAGCTWRRVIIQRGSREERHYCLKTSMVIRNWIDGTEACCLSWRKREGPVHTFNGNATPLR